MIEKFYISGLHSSNNSSDESLPLASSHSTIEPPETPALKDDTSAISNAACPSTSICSTELTIDEPHGYHDRLGVVSLAVLVFYSVSGGPFGVEAAVRSAGNFYTLVGFLLVPLVWSLQETMMTAELVSAFPNDSSGGVVWVEHAFGQRAAWMAGYLSWVGGATDNSIYPVLFLEYLVQMLHRQDGDATDSTTLHPWLRFCALAATSVLLAYINWLGLALVGRMSTSICIIAMSPFIVLSVVGVFQCDPKRWFQLPDAAVIDDDDLGGGFFPNTMWGGVLWRPFLNNVFWNLNSFDSAASFAADVHDTARVFPTAMMWALVLVVAGYLVPLLVALGASKAPQHDWVDGFFANVASDIVGPWLGAWTVFAAGISNIAMFQAELSSDAYKLMGMAERGYLPKLFTRRSRHGTPTYCILLCTAVIVVMGVSHLDQLIEMLNFNYAIALLFEYSAFIKLRMSRPELLRPWRVPLNTIACALALVPTFVMTFVVLGLATYTTYAFCIAANIIGLLAYWTKDHYQFQPPYRRSYSSVAVNEENGVPPVRVQAYGTVGV